MVFAFSVDKNWYFKRVFAQNNFKFCQARQGDDHTCDMYHWIHYALMCYPLSGYNLTHVAPALKGLFNKDSVLKRYITYRENVKYNA